MVILQIIEEINLISILIVTYFLILSKGVILSGFEPV